MPPPASFQRISASPADHAAIGEIDHGLVVEHPVLVVDRPPQPLSEREANQRDPPLRSRRTRGRRAPIRFARYIAMSAFLSSDLGVVRVAREQADADRSPGMELRAVQIERLGQHVVHTPGHPARGVVDGIVVEVGEQHEELVPALSGYEVGLADARVQPLRELGQHQVAGVVPEGVVHELEVVQVEEDDRDARVVALGSLDRENEGLLEQLAIREAR